MKKQVIILVLFALAALVGPVGAGSRVAVGCRVVPPVCPVALHCRQAPVYYFYSPGDGFAVRTQLILSRMGYHVGEIDGEIGPLTRRAIQRYQAMSGLVVTGSINDSLIRSLGIR